MESRDINGWLNSRRSTKGTRRPSYIRRIKPPFSYTELIRQAILASPGQALTLRQIVACLQNGFSCFCGPYQGWRNSVRHNLSSSSCFVKLLRDPNKPNGKDNFWVLNDNCNCVQCSKGVNQSAVSMARLPPSNFRPVMDIARFQQIPEFPSIEKPSCESESCNSKIKTTKPSPTLQTDFDQVQIGEEKLIVDTQTKDTDVNNEDDAEACQNEDVDTPVDLAGDRNNASSTSPTLVELKRPEEYAIDDSSEEKSALLTAVDTNKLEDKLEWHEMTFTNIADLNFVQPATQSTRYKLQDSINWNKAPQRPSEFMTTPYLRQGQYNYPYAPYNPRSNPFHDGMYQTVPSQEFNIAPAAYWMGNYNDSYYQSMQTTSNAQWHQYQHTDVNSEPNWTHL